MDRTGLTQDEASRRLREEGPNVLPSARPKHLGRVMAEVLSEPMLLLLLGAGTVYFVLGDLGEASAMLVSVGAVVAIAAVQARKTERALEALRDLSAPRALVLRDGEERRIPGAGVVRGDLVVLKEGDRIPADARLLEGLLQVDESLLTGESAPATRRPGEDGALSGGTLAAKGLALAEVTATGPRSRMGRIGQSLADTAPEPTGLERASRSLVRRLAILGLGLAAAAVLLAWRWDGRDLLSSLLVGLALAMAILPEEIPVVLSVFTALGAWRLSRRGVLTRRIPAVEALGATTLLAVDKTGTLTQNRMAVTELYVPDAFREVEDAGPLPEAFHALVEFSILATPLDPFDPMEKALQAYGKAALEGTEHLHGAWEPEAAYELSPEILAMTHVYPLASPGRRLLATKGAPEAIVDLCHLPEDAAARVRDRVETLARRGLRVLGVARGTWGREGLPRNQHDFDFEFLGLVGLQDPPRPEVPAALEACREAGIRVLMMTGDHPLTALAIARQVGLPVEGETLLGDEVESLPEPELQARLRGTSICARLRPEHKLRLVRALQADGEAVAMTGDGVNDAPALKAAQVGVAMGARGTDVAREAAALVLTDDSFGSLVEAVRMGRRVYGNLARSLRFVFAVHVPVLGLSLVPLLLRWPPTLLPLHIVLLELLIDPACSVVLEAEPEPPDLMRRPPRPSSESPFAGPAVRGALVQGLGVLVLLLGLEGWALARGWAPETMRAALLPGLILGALGLILANRREGKGPLGSLRDPNPWLPATLAGVLGFLALLQSLAPLRRLMGLGPRDLRALGAGLGAAALAFLWLEASARVSSAPGGPPSPSGSRRT